ncbi:MAG: universal stress protein [Gammaproteobacteria bacterium]
MRLDSVLFYLDTRLDRSLRQAADCLARVARLLSGHGGRIILCDAITQPGEAGTRVDLHERLLELRRGLAHEALTRLVAACPVEVATEIVICAGKPLPDIIRLSVERRVDLTVCIPSSEPDDTLDSMSLHLLRKCPGPVWIMREAPAQRIARIAVAVDREIFAGSDHPRIMANKLLDAAIAFARPSGAEIHLVHAWEVYGAELLAVMDNHLDADEIQRYRDTQRYAHTVWLQELHERLRHALAAHNGAAVNSTVHLVEGAPGAVLPAWVASLGVDLLMLGTLGSSAAPGLLIGTNAETIVSATQAPILALKPDGFRSPLAPAGVLS